MDQLIWIVLIYVEHVITNETAETVISFTN